MLSPVFRSMPALLVFSTSLLVPIDGFVLKPSHSKLPIAYQGNNEDEPDLFDYFDPLLSPHAYPNGIQPGVEGQVPDGEFRDPLRLNLIPRDDVDPLKQKGAPINPDFFDPTISPHAYRNGTPDTLGGDKRAIEALPQQDAEMSDYNPFRLSKILTKGVERAARPTKTAFLPDVFDPLLSPHSYPNGTPEKLVVDQRKVGVLLMDHGSRNQASNDRLHELAKIYQQNVASHVIVKAAHMELASPTIPEALEALMLEGVEEIVCHPYFLSANGRHVSEDIPEIINGAIETLNIQIPVVTTDPVGSQTDIMIGAIQNMVLQHSSILKETD
jgi:hypothetical protein